jgi:hypothetical protein
MFCNECGGANPDGAKFCNACGKSLVVPTQPLIQREPGIVIRQFPTQMATPAHVDAHWDSSSTEDARSSSGLKRFLTIIAGVAIVVGIYLVVFGSPSSSGPRYKVGDTVHIGYWSYLVTDAQWQKSLGSEYFHKQGDALYLVVRISARNDDKTASIRPPFQLVDSAGREYDETADEVYLGDSDIIKNVNPGVTATGHIAFDVPQGQYALKVLGGFGSSKSAFVDLPF